MGLDGRRLPRAPGGAVAAVGEDRDAARDIPPIIDDSDDGAARARAAAAVAMICFGLVSGPPPFPGPRDANGPVAADMSWDARRDGDGLTPLLPVAPLMGGIAGTIVDG